MRPRYPSDGKTYARKRNKTVTINLSETEVALLDRVTEWCKSSKTDAILDGLRHLEELFERQQP